jgi:hypothetical protein
MRHAFRVHPPTIRIYRSSSPHHRHRASRIRHPTKGLGGGHWLPPLLWPSRGLTHLAGHLCCALASEQSIATLGTVKRLNRLLGFVSSHRDGHRVFNASDMILAVLSDASYLSVLPSRSQRHWVFPPPVSCASLGSAVRCSHVH